MSSQPSPWRAAAAWGWSSSVGSPVSGFITHYSKREGRREQGDDGGREVGRLEIEEERWEGGRMDPGKEGGRVDRGKEKDGREGD